MEKLSALHHEQLQRIGTDDIGDLVYRLAVEAFGSQSVNRYGQRLGHDITDINVGHRHFSMQDRGTCDKVPELADQEMPLLYISFNWDNRPDHEDRSSKEDDQYAVRRNIQQDTMEAIHKIRDGIIRQLAKYTVVITYIPVGDRRKSLYQGILAGSGFKVTSDGLDSYWYPANLSLTSPTATKPGQIWPDD